jgi:hypothetical protein
VTARDRLIVPLNTWVHSSYIEAASTLIKLTHPDMPISIKYAFPMREIAVRGERFNQSTQKFEIIPVSDGGHWHAILLDPIAHHCTYFDPYGAPPHKDLTSFILANLNKNPHLPQWTVKPTQIRLQDDGFQWVIWLIEQLS